MKKSPKHIQTVVDMKKINRAKLKLISPFSSLLNASARLISAQTTVKIIKTGGVKRLKLGMACVIVIP
jgi:hypothetical protein